MKILTVPLRGPAMLHRRSTRERSRGRRRVGGQGPHCHFYREWTR